MNKKDATKTLSILMTVYPHIKIDNPDIMARAWEMCLGEYDSDIVATAVRLHLKSNKYFPSIAEIVKLIPRASLLIDPSEVKQIESHIEQARVDGEALFNWLSDDDPTEECLCCDEFKKCYLQK